jgi:L-aspartate oxidase
VRRSADVVVIGSGAAGLSAALGLAATRNVLLETSSAMSFNYHL